MIVLTNEIIICDLFHATCCYIKMGKMDLTHKLQLNGVMPFWGL